MSQQTGQSISTLQCLFNAYEVKVVPTKATAQPINLVFDATFFSRTDGLLLFRAHGQNLHWQFIRSETLREVQTGLDILDARGFPLKSVTIDGRRGVIQLLKQHYPDVPIQLCHFHQQQIIPRYTTKKPKINGGQALKLLMTVLGDTEQELFQSLLDTLKEEYADFLKERNDNGQFKHRKLRSAFRSLNTNMPYLFTYKNFPKLNIPNTTNSCDGYFAHLKQKIKIHRGLKKHRRNKAINLFLKMDDK